MNMVPAINILINLGMILSILYLFTSGQDYMNKMAVLRGDSIFLDKLMLGSAAMACMIGLFYFDINTLSPFAYVTAVLMLHLVKLVFNSRKWRKQNPHHHDRTI